MAENRTGFTVYTQQVHDAFGPPKGMPKHYYPDRGDIIIENVFGQDGLRPDVVVLTEAYADGIEAVAQAREAEEAIKNADYSVQLQSYLDVDGRRDRHGMLMAVKDGVLIAPFRTKTLAGRLSLWTTIRVRDEERDEQEVDVWGIHLDDRLERARQWGVKDLNHKRSEDDRLGAATVLAGTVNAVEFDAPHAGMMRFLGQIASHLPQHTPGTRLPPWPFSLVPRNGSILFRHGEMASGETMRLLDDSGYYDADSQHRPTAADPDGHWHHLFSQLDRIMHTRHLRVVENGVEVGYDPRISSRAYVMAEFALRAA